jgi:lipoic acid synthetase
VPRLYKVARHGGRYERTLELFRRARRAAPRLLTKSGIILGLGEGREELLETMRDLRGADVNILTLGQYLRPSAQHLPVARFYTPAEFSELAEAGRVIGFAHVESGPLVRSSYHAKRQVAGVGTLMDQTAAHSKRWGGPGTPCEAQPEASRANPQQERRSLPPGA